MTTLRTTCPDCGAPIGSSHRGGCDVERCTACKGQRLQCACAGHDPLAAAWSGEFPGVARARELGWYSVLIPHVGWRTCSADTPGASEDLTRLAIFERTGVDRPSPPYVPGEWYHEYDRTLWSALTSYGAHPNASVRAAAGALLAALIGYEAERKVSGLASLWESRP